ncbi:MAG TPA: hypothetical protein PLJ27_03440 [Polyangiaceae bacterium]|nr:MAG: hypothetical protein BWY17_02660 [Deltaproteobacteria bacterium ADurb.Bin207]HNZ22399.1 hypothetical protein [Polyangiaceae bacterium]HOD20934.1 hypothetical protein [Polyangiaceae bacterium]HOE48292.1 hypothetical protein [Polyangiaceae bacterium]HOH00068.1 hypothetical protein [Polyangiaceae bacterium]
MRLCILFVGILGVGNCLPAASSMSAPTPAAPSMDSGSTTPSRSRFDDAILAPLLIGARDSLRASFRKNTGDSVMVVSYGGDGLRLLDACHVPGSYVFVPTSPRLGRERVTPSDAPNLPWFEGGSSLSAEQSMPISVVRSGVSSTSLQGVYRDELRGDCGSATHFVVRIDFGSATMGEDEAPGPPTVAACTDPAQNDCEPVQIQLRAIAAARPPEAWSERLPPPNDACPQGLRWTGLLCAKHGLESECTESNQDGCGRQCEQGDAHACARLSKPIDDSLLDRACEAGVPSACHREGQKPDTARLQRGCWLGSPRACALYADLSLLSESPAPDGMLAWRRACEGGMASWCWSWGLAATSGDERFLGLRAFDAWVLGCQRGHRASCYEAFKLLESQGKTAQGVAYAVASCADPDPNWQGCLALGEWLVQQEQHDSTARGAEVFQRVCAMNVRAGCLRAAQTTGDAERSIQLLGRACQLGDLQACMQAATRSHPTTAEGRRWLVEACDRFRHPPACEQLKGSKQK